MASSVQSSTCCNGNAHRVHREQRARCVVAAHHTNKIIIKYRRGKAKKAARAHLISLTYGFNFTVKSFLDTNHHQYVDVQQWKHLFLICRSISFFSQIIFTIIIVIAIIVQQHINGDADVHFRLGFVFVEMFALKNQIIMIFFCCLLYLLVVAEFGIKTKNWKRKEKKYRQIYLIWFCNARTGSFLSLLCFSSSDRFIDSNLVISNKIHIKLLSTHFSSR